VIARWMLAATLFAALCAVAAFAGERAMRAMRRPTRWPWVVALIVGAAWPAIAPFVLTAPSLDAGADGGNVVMRLIPIATETPSTTFTLEQFEAPLRAAWMIGSALLLLQIVLAIRTIARVRRGANEQAVHGEQILVNEHMGPAVIGVLRPRIVVPTWLLELDDSLRALIVRHEREHCRAGDPKLVWLSVAITTLFPFNAALWFISRRLRLAMEIDCDARTLRGESDPSRYAKLLLLIAQQSHSARFAPTLSHSTSQLALRIRAMQNPVTRFRALRVVIALGVAGGAGAAACSSRVASNLTSPTPSTSASPAAAMTTAKGPVAQDPSLPYFDFQVEQQATVVPGSPGPKYPESLRKQGVSGIVLGQFVVKEDGTVDLATLKIITSPSPELSAAVREGLKTMRFKPALVGNKPVKQLVQAPFDFSISSKSERGSVGEAQAVQPKTQSPASPPTPLDGSSNSLATAKAGNPSPEYPAALRQAGIKGVVLTQFIVNADGTVDAASLKVLKSDHPEFTESVKKTLPNLRFEPAKVEGRAVRQLMQMPFEFWIADVRDMH
jgi:TonB family protein